MHELRDILSFATSEQLALSQRDAERPSYLGNVQEKSARHLVTLDEKDDQRIYRDDAFLRRMRRSSVWEGHEEQA